jgi:murein DD-endopeptidase MepM/ murein hydrolase activator NlpD
VSARLLAAAFFVLALGWAAPPASALDLNGVFMQGGMVKGKAEPGLRILLDDEEIFIGPGGDFVFGFGRDAPPKATLTIVHPDGAEDYVPLAVAPQSYRIEPVDGLPPETVEIPEAEKARREKERDMVREARAKRTTALDWVGGFKLPAEGRISGVYGSQRILNGEPAYPHYGIDIAAPVGTPVRAPASGRVVLAQPDFLLEGGIIIIDHGFEVSSTLMHLSQVAVKVGQIVRQGERVGAVGATGRANGPHVDWRVNWGEVRLDPALLVGQIPQVAQ